MIKIQELSGIEFGFIILFMLLLSILFAEIFDYTRTVKLPDCYSFQYGYRNRNGPATWKDKFPHAKGRLQSPINITTRFACVVPCETQKPIKFSPDFFIVPKCMELLNDGHSVTLSAHYEKPQHVPYVCGGPLRGTYHFHNARFRWGPTDNNGSEHTIDLVRYAMEVQAIFVRIDHALVDISKAAEANALVIFSFLFQVTPFDNPCLEALVNNLQHIKTPLAQIAIEPIPLSWLLPPFNCQYFSYMGSLTFPPCTEGIQWIVQSEPLSISCKQVNAFRKLCTFDGPIYTNARPVQELSCRDVFLHD